MSLSIWTIGHTTRTIEQFVELLSGQAIELLADVRSYPGSRKYPHFNAAPLSDALREVGIEYAPFRELGGRRKPNLDSPHTVWRHAAFRGYADYMDTPEFRAGLDRLLETAREKRTAICCSEAVWWRCHRSMIADALKAEGIEVLHIMEGGKLTEHPYTSAAQVVEGRLLYGAG